MRDARPIYRTTIARRRIRIAYPARFPLELPAEPLTFFRANKNFDS
jgi:hypothetical protein